jgi:hypothetical protein
MSLFASLIAVTALSTSTTMSELQEYSCSALVRSPEGSIEVIEDKSLSVLGQVESKASFDYGRENTLAIRCLRSDIVPAVKDWRVLDAGYPLNIVDVSTKTGRVGVLEVSGGQYRFRMIQGELTSGDMERLQHRLDEIQVASSV